MNHELNMLHDIKYMRRCIQLARCGEAGAAPNPMVGAVVVCDGRIIGEGYHRRCGGPHAEVNAIGSVRERHLLGQSTIYVSLEPCSHFGKTPPCTDLIIRSGIPRVVVGCTDPFAKVNGQGIKKLQDAGCEVVVGVLEQECRELNRRFFTFHQKHRPWITLKWAQSEDGFIAPPSSSGKGEIEGAVFFSNALTQTLVHRMRARHQAILVGTTTALVDNPTLQPSPYPSPQRRQHTHRRLYPRKPQRDTFRPLQPWHTESPRRRRCQVAAELHRRRSLGRSPYRNGSRPLGTRRGGTSPRRQPVGKRAILWRTSPATLPPQVVITHNEPRKSLVQLSGFISINRLSL